jgi:hypothetical protein
VFALFGLLIAATFLLRTPLKELALLWILDGIYLLESGAGITAQVFLKDSQAFLGATNYNLAATSAMVFRSSNG